MYVYRDLIEGNEITVFVPASEELDDCAERVPDIGNTLRALEGRDRSGVRGYTRNHTRTGSANATCAHDVK